MSKILLIEDVLDKSEKIKKCVNNAFPDIAISERSSYHSALKETAETRRETGRLRNEGKNDGGKESGEFEEEENDWKDCMTALVVNEFL